jgi:hypothetical protein
MMRIFAYLLVSLSPFFLRAQVTSLSGDYEGRSHFIIKTPTATYYLDRASGGLSRLIDRHGRDWISYKTDPWNKVPASAASSFRGIPNLVFQGDDGGVGHPGWNTCVTSQLTDSSYLVTGLSSKWSFSWNFSDGGALVTILRVDTTRRYWFLYEGPVAGRFAPSEQYWATNVDGIRSDIPNIFDVDSRAQGYWDWAYFGDTGSDVVLYVAQQTPDHHLDFFAYMGDSAAQNSASDGMVVFGFGRADKPLLNSRNISFRIGLIEGISIDNESYLRVRRFIEDRY